MSTITSRFATLLLSCAGMVSMTAVLGQGTPLAVELLPLGKDIGIAAGQTVTPAYEGWYRKEDGSLALSFGYYNRNTEEILDLPIGPGNRIIGAPDGEANQGQPTHFIPDRHWGVFTITVPADYQEQVVWHLENQGKTFHVPANLHTDYIIDAIVGDANGNFPPQLRFQEEGAMGHGPAGISAGPMQARVGEPLTLDVWASDDGNSSGLAAVFLANSPRKPPLNLTWFKHQGAGKVAFEDDTLSVPVTGGQATTTVSFDEPGDYVLRLRINEFGGPGMAGHAQCCWTNGFLQVSVSD